MDIENMSKGDYEREIVKCLEGNLSLFTHEIVDILRSKKIKTSTRKIAQICSHSNKIEKDSSRRTRLKLSWRLAK